MTKQFRLPVEQFDRLLKEHPCPVIQKCIEEERIKNDGSVVIQKFVKFEFCNEKDEVLVERMNG